MLTVQRLAQMKERADNVDCDIDGYENWYAQDVSALLEDKFIGSYKIRKFLIQLAPTPEHREIMAHSFDIEPFDYGSKTDWLDLMVDKLTKI